MFENPIDYPDLQLLQGDWGYLRDQAMPQIHLARQMEDSRSRPGDWSTVPLKVEPEDELFVEQALVDAGRAAMPGLCLRLDRVFGIQSYALSIVEPGGEIKPHTHQNPFASASLCLSGGAGAFMVVDREKHEFYDGSMAVFDYRYSHAVYNQGSEPRVALIAAVTLAVT